MAAIAILPILLGALIGGGASILAYGPGFGDFITARLNKLFQQRYTSAQESVRAFRKGIIDESKFYENMSANGFSRSEADILKRVDYDSLTVSEILTLYFRYIGENQNPLGITETWLQDQMKKAGVPVENVSHVVEANKPVPSLQDIITFTAKDVFEEKERALITKGFKPPERFLLEAKKRGLSEEHATWFWDSHWYVPSIHQAFEMVQRLYDHPDPETRFTQEHLEWYFNIADFAPGLRKRLQAISYHPINKVDVFRFYRLGLFGFGEAAKDKLTRRFREIGYSPQDAIEMANFTIKKEGPGDKRLTSTLILKSYREGAFKPDGRKQAEELLSSIGYDPKEIKLILDLEDLILVSQEEQEAIEKIKVQYFSSVKMSDSQLRSLLSGIGIAQSLVNELVDEWKDEKKRNVKKITVSQAEKLRRVEAISNKELQEIYEENGYSTEDAKTLLKQFAVSSKAGDREPSIADVKKWYAEGLIEKEEFVSILVDLGIRRRYIDLYAAELGKPLS